MAFTDWKRTSVETDCGKEAGGGCYASVVVAVASTSSSALMSCTPPLLEKAIVLAVLSSFCGVTVVVRWAAFSSP